MSLEEYLKENLISKFFFDKHPNDFIVSCTEIGFNNNYSQVCLNDCAVSLSDVTQLGAVVTHEGLEYNLARDGHWLVVELI